jgi:hypothetical protein
MINVSWISLLKVWMYCIVDIVIYNCQYKVNKLQIYIWFMISMSYNFNMNKLIKSILISLSRILYIKFIY